MDFSRLIRRLEKLAVDNSPAILTAIGITGTVTTAYLTGKASFRAKEILDQKRLDNYSMNPDPLKEEIKAVWMEYIPAGVSCILTCGAIFGANHVSSRRATAMATAYSISERAFAEYKEKVVEKLGEKKEQTFRDEIAQNRTDRNPPDDKTVIITDTGDVLCHDSFSGRYFKSSMETIKQAQNEINHQILHDGYASLNDLYFHLELPPTAAGEEVGWGSDKLLKMIFSTTMTPHNRPCIVMDFDVRPNRKFDRLI